MHYDRESTILMFTHQKKILMRDIKNRIVALQNGATIEDDYLSSIIAKNYFLLMPISTILTEIKWVLSGVRAQLNKVVGLNWQPQYKEEPVDSETALYTILEELEKQEYPETPDEDDRDCTYPTPYPPNQN